MLVKSTWLKKKLNNKNVKIIDASWYLPNSKRDAYREFRNNHIKNAVFFNIDKICDDNNSLPHMLPSKRKFEIEVSKLGINNYDTLIIYCNTGVLSSPRVWWTFYLFGHKKVYVLDGGLKAWKISGGVLTNHNNKFIKSNYKCKNMKKNLVISYSNLTSILNDNNLQLTILDARPMLRFLKIEDEPRNNIGKGTIPNSVNYPQTLFDTNGFLKSKKKIREILKNPINKNDLIVCSCGSGIAACNIAFSLQYIGNQNWTLYDGSWTEWYLNKKN